MKTPSPDIPVLTAIDGRSARVSGWYYLWLRYVYGFDPSQHCAPGLIAARDRRFGPALETHRPIPLDQAKGWKHLYLCGGAKVGGWAANLHLAMEHAPGESAIITASTGAVFRVTNVRALPIPPLPDGFDGRGRSFTTCRNWQFGVAYYGLHPTPPAFDPRERRYARRATSDRTLV